MTASQAEQDEEITRKRKAAVDQQEATTQKKSLVENHPLLREESKGMNPASLLTGYYGTRGERIRHTVHKGALTLPAKALELIVPLPSSSSNNEESKPKWVLPKLDCVIRPTLESHSEKNPMVVTRVWQAQVSVPGPTPQDPPALTMQTYVRNVRVSGDDEATERIRGGGGSEEPPQRTDGQQQQQQQQQQRSLQQQQQQQQQHAQQPSLQQQQPQGLQSPARIQFLQPLTTQQAQQQFQLAQQRQQQQHMQAHHQQQMQQTQQHPQPQMQQTQQHPQQQQGQQQMQAQQQQGQQQMGNPQQMSNEQQNIQKHQYQLQQLHQQHVVQRRQQQMQQQEELRRQHELIVQQKQEELRRQHEQSVQQKQEELRQQHEQSVQQKQEELRRQNEQSVQQKQEELRRQNEQSVQQKQEELRQQHEQKLEQQQKLLRQQQEEQQRRQIQAQAQEQQRKEQEEQQKRKLIIQQQQQEELIRRQQQQEHQMQLQQEQQKMMQQQRMSETMSAEENFSQQMQQQLKAPPGTVGSVTGDPGIPVQSQSTASTGPAPKQQHETPVLPTSSASAQAGTSTPHPTKKAVPVVVGLKETPEEQWEQHVPGANDEMSADSVSKTPKPEWYKPDGISDLERVLLPEWFDGSATHRTPETYKKSRETLIKISSKLGTRYLTATMARRSIPGDAGSLIRLHEFLTVYALINEEAINDSAPTPASLQGKSKVPIQWPPSRCRALMHAIMEESKKRPKIEDGGDGFVPINWDSIAVEVGATATECEKQFLHMEIPESPREGSITPEPTASAESKEEEESESVTGNVHDLFDISDLLASCNPKLVRAVTNAALANTSQLSEAQKATIAGLALSQEVQTAVTEEGAVARLLSEVVDLRMKKLENRLAMLDDAEGLLEAERVALELERRDLYTARCRNWFGGP